MCEAYAEKKGYRTERRGRPDHQRAGSELIRDTVDGIVPLFFLPPNYKGSDPHAFERNGGKQNVVDDESDGDSDSEAEEEEEESEEEEDDEEPTPSPKAAQKKPAAKINAFSLLDSSSDEDSDSDSD